MEGGSGADGTVAVDAELPGFLEALTGMMFGSEKENAKGIAKGAVTIPNSQNDGDCDGDVSDCSPDRNSSTFSFWWEDIARSRNEGPAVQQEW
jgi:hypothetical protein